MMKLYQDVDDAIRHMNQVYEAQELEDKNSMHRKALNIVLWGFMILCGITAAILLVMVYQRG